MRERMSEKGWARDLLYKPQIADQHAETRCNQHPITPRLPGLVSLSLVIPVLVNSSKALVGGKFLGVRMSS